MKNKTFIIIMSILLGPTILLLIFGLFFSLFENNSSSNKSWDNGFNYEWVGTYVSKADADYVVAFKLGTDGTYAFIYGSNPNISTTYSGKYNKNFKYGISKSGLNYKITDLKIIGLDKNNKSINIAIDWDNPRGKSTDYYTLFFQY